MKSESPVRIVSALILSAAFAALGAAPAHAGYIDHFARRDDVGKFKVPATGTSRILVVPVVNALSSNHLNLARLNAFFERDTPAPGGADQWTFRQYWQAHSRGAFTPEVEVVDALEFRGCPLPPSFPNCTIPRGDVSALYTAISVLEESLRRLDAETSIDFTRYDLNGPGGVPDGWIDGVLFITNFGSGGIAFPLGLLREGGPIVLDGVGITAIAIGDEPFVAMHEFGHLLGFADLYNEAQTTTDLPYSVMGGWRYDPNVPLLDAFSRVQIGWADVQEVTGTMEVTVPPVTDGGVVFKLGSGKEFFLVENRGPAAPWDAGMTTRGLAVWHVNLRKLPGPDDTSFLQTLLNCVNCEPFRGLVSLVEADGRYDLQQKRASNDEADLFRDGDTLHPGADGQKLDESHIVFNSNRYTGHVTGIAIDAIDTMSAAPAIKVTLTVPAGVLTPCADVDCPGDKTCVVVGETGECREPEPVIPDGGTPATPDAGTPATGDGGTIGTGGGGGGGCVFALERPTPAALFVFALELLGALYVAGWRPRRR